MPTHAQTTASADDAQPPAWLGGVARWPISLANSMLWTLTVHVLK